MKFKLFLTMVLFGFVLYLPWVANQDTGACGQTTCANATPIVCAAGVTDCGIPLATPVGFATPTVIVCGTDGCPTP